MTLNHTNISTRIREILEANTTPDFPLVFQGPIMGLPVGGPYACFRYLGRIEEGQTLRGQIQVSERWQIQAFWQAQPERATLPAADVAMADADQALHTVFRADATLSGANDTTLTITDSQVLDGVSFPFGVNAGAKYVALQFELHLPDREAEPTVP